MKITKIRTQVVNARLRNWIFVRIETDQPGLTGLGEATLEFQTRAVVGAIEDLASLIIGEDPRNIEHIWQVLFRHPFFKGGIVTMSALSGIDQALHDIKARSLNIPLWQLLGGLTRKKLRMYDHLGGGDSLAVYDSARSESFAEKAARSREDGFTAVKILAVGRTKPLDSHAALKSAEALMAAAREGAGDAMDIMVDLHGRTSAAMAIQYAEVLKPYRPWFLEEPCQPEDVGGIARVAQATTIPIASGERLCHRHEFLQLLQAGAISVAQPDVCHAGGLTEVRRIAALCDTFGVSMAPHNPLGPVATMVNIHLGFATPNFLVQEVMRSDVPWRDEVVSGGAPIEGGHVLPPQGPGIGIEIDEAAAERHPWQDALPIQWYHDDGSVADW
ncbi:galactonate dehydratase [Ponticoccus sp. SC2-23]|uniref:galactonate dehydratase n=1 Tax=Alexandriicola marinus TaxID=2081710 RepID=UPI000FDAA5D0|nr:galactonate dehydratase [Alexandriicola marinus]MBM1218672.1 galactonate dehydratase [Ponticoccus sp. SC6-9]MBM1224256.1 galactonate dehydratase [Ponticoccus sp. SC6-15]MBM1229965.1 galactonate dehydratase [Ponticoccus sp. SC6-38]MBM1233222.1 galactonate dehydratase [Ponticoccus sp. SC6-45]MBM1236828.1 galactonate dehydratase [Ponticoccus sp. SC6-49]MBM1242233.1 galactonate dehydratase [Ponticoccus sp. SC2-64]MBM1246746.1 galactonate dehydratase [Ponticoccus sp. SC6-42]MBM1251224.1 galac